MVKAVAYRATRDPATLANLLAEALRERGLRATAEWQSDATNYYEYWVIVTEYHDPSARITINFFRRVPGTYGETWHRHISMAQARVALMRILELLQDATVEDAMKALQDAS
jgi:hypothetical protein